MPIHYLYLLMAVLAETIGTSALHASQQFTRIVPSIIAILGYGSAFYLLSLTLKVMPVGVVYAIWCGLGIAFIAIIGWTVFGQKLDAAALIGIGMILAGILVIQLFSSSVEH